MSSRFFVEDGFVYVDIGSEINLIGDFFELLKQNQIDFDLKNVLGTNFETQKIIKLVPEKELCRVRLSSDNLYAFMSLFPIFPPSINMEEILGMLAELKVTEGIDRGLIQKIIVDRQPVTDMPVAKGIPPIPGSPQIIINHYNPSDKIELKVDEDGNVDFKNLDNVVNVKKGTVVATRTREYEPVPGIDIFGNIIEPPPAVDISFDVGKGIIVVDDEAIAYMDGYLEWDDRDRLNVNNTMIIKGDVAYGTGNLDIDGSILVKGDVLPGFIVKASKNIDIMGSAEDASILAGGDINIRGSVVGKKGCDVTAGGDIKVNYAQNSTLKAKGSVHITRYVYNTSILSDDMIYINSREGVIFGDSNKLIAKNAVYIKSILQEKPLEITVTGFSRSEYSELLSEVENDVVKKLELIRESGNRKITLLAQKSEARNNNELFELMKQEQSFKEDLNVLNKLKKRLTLIVNRIPQPGVIEIDKSACLRLTVAIGSRSTTVAPFNETVRFISDDELEGLVMK